MEVQLPSASASHSSSASQRLSNTVGTSGRQPRFDVRGRHAVPYDTRMSETFVQGSVSSSTIGTTGSSRGQSYGAGAYTGKGYHYPPSRNFDSVGRGGFRAPRRVEPSGSATRFATSRPSGNSSVASSRLSELGLSRVAVRGWIETEHLFNSDGFCVLCGIDERKVASCSASSAARGSSSVPDCDDTRSSPPS